MNFNPDLQLRLSIQKALLQEVTPDLVGVTCGRSDKLIEIVAYYDHPVSEEQWEQVRSIGAEVIGDFPEGYDITEVARETTAGLIPLDFWAFRRADPEASTT